MIATGETFEYPTKGISFTELQKHMAEQQHEIQLEEFRKIYGGHDNEVKEDWEMLFIEQEKAAEERRKKRQAEEEAKKKKSKEAKKSGK